MTTTAQRLVILGLDGATWTVLDPMRRLGLMPNLDALLARSAHGTLRSVVPPVTSAAWTSMMTGCGPARHGVFDHRYFDTAAGQMKVNHSGRVRVPTFWHLLSEAGRSVVSLNVPVTYPPLDVRGRGRLGDGRPAPRRRPLGRARVRPRGSAPRSPATASATTGSGAPQSLDELTENARLTVELFRGRAEGGLLADRGRARLVGPDGPVPEPRPVPAPGLELPERRRDRASTAPTGTRAARGVLRGLDDAIGLLCELADEAVGARPGRQRPRLRPVPGPDPRQPDPDRRRRRPAAGPGGHGSGGASRRGATTSGSGARSGPTPRRGRRRSTTSVVAQFPFDWKRTLAFAPHQDTAAMVYLNTAARRAGAPLQTLAPDRRRPRRGRRRRSPRRGTPRPGVALFPQIIDTAEAYGIDPAREGYPDLIALPDENYWVRTKLAPGPAWVEADAEPPRHPPARGDRRPRRRRDRRPAGRSRPTSATSRRRS